MEDELEKLFGEIILDTVNPVCPVCKEFLTKSEMGIRSHLRKHIREGKLTKEQELFFIYKLTGREKL